MSHTSTLAVLGTIQVCPVDVWWSLSKPRTVVIPAAVLDYHHDAKSSLLHRPIEISDRNSILAMGV